MSLLSLAPLALAFLPQTVRTPVEVAAESFGRPPVPASAGDLSVELHEDALNNGLKLRVSDGRGIEWGSEIRVDQASPPPSIGARIPFVDGDRAIAVWWDDRNYDVALWPIVARTAFVRVFDGATGQLGPEIPVPTATPLERTQIEGFDVAFERVGAELRVHVALALTVSPAASPSYQQVLLVTSNDGGASFGAPLAMSPPISSGVFRQAMVHADGDDVAVAWTHGSVLNTVQLYLRTSSDGGQTADGAAPVQQTTSYPLTSAVLGATGSTLAFAMERFVPDFVYVDMAVIVSTDGGATFSNPAVLGDTGKSAAVGVTADGGAVVVAWQESITGSQQIHRARTTDGGATWSPPAQISSSGGLYATLTPSGPGRDRMIATWRGSTGPMAAVSLDGGATFASEIALDDAPSYAFSGVPCAFNDAYQNALCAWTAHAGTKPRFVGGLRPQFVEPTGFAGGSTSIGATLAGFDDGSSLAFVVFSSATGDLFLPFGDGRNLGLAPTSLFLQTLNLALAGPFASPLAPDGSGALGPIAIPPLPSGATVFGAALAFDLGTLSFGDVSDVVELGL